MWFFLYRQITRDSKTLSITGDFLIILGDFNVEFHNHSSTSFMNHRNFGADSGSIRDDHPSLGLTTSSYSAYLMDCLKSIASQITYPCLALNSVIAELPHSILIPIPKIESIGTR